MKSREEEIKELQEVCEEIGCTCVSKELRDHPHMCKIIRKLVNSDGRYNNGGHD